MIDRARIIGQIMNAVQKDVSETFSSKAYLGVFGWGFFFHVRQGYRAAKAQVV